LTKKFIGKNGSVAGLSCVRVDFSAGDQKGCPVMQEVAGSGFKIEADLVILALGFLHPERKGIIDELKLKLDSRDNVETGADFMTSVPGIFAAGDMHRGQSLIVWAIAEGRRTAHFIDKYLMTNTVLPAF
jgi:glutamate synthase (NADPH/NADH) small chain